MGGTSDNNRPVLICHGTESARLAIPLRPTTRQGLWININSGTVKRVFLFRSHGYGVEPDSPFQKFTREGDKTSGPGAAGMKGGLAIMLSALKALK